VTSPHESKHSKVWQTWKDSGPQFPDPQPFKNDEAIRICQQIQGQTDSPCLLVPCLLVPGLSQRRNRECVRLPRADWPGYTQVVSSFGLRGTHISLLNNQIKINRTFNYVCGCFANIGNGNKDGCPNAFGRGRKGSIGFTDNQFWAVCRDEFFARKIDTFSGQLVGW
jgi:hypothetical protein